jgi:MFS family permease
MPSPQSDERSPLLGQQTSPANGQAVDSEASTSANAQTDGVSEVIVAEEPSTRRLLIIIGSMWIGCYFAALDTSIVATLTGPISSEFNSQSLLSWIATGYLIANAACQPLSGKLTDIFSRRYGAIFSNVFFCIGTLICGLAPNAATIIAGRVIAGIGGGGLTCIGTFVTSDLVPLRRRGIWQGWGNLVFGAGMGSGGLIGGLFADNLSWRWAFLFQIPFIIVSTVLVWIYVDIPVNPSTKPSLRRIDFAGAITLVLSLVLLLIGLNTGGNQLPWSHPLIITSLALSVLFLATFIYLETHPTLIPEPMIPVSLIIRSRTVFFSYAANWFGTMAVFLSLYYIPLYLQSVLSLTSTRAGLRVIPFAAALSPGSLVTGWFMRKTGKYYTYHILALSVLVLGSALTCTFTTNSPAWTTFVYVIPLGYGYGAMLTVTLVAMISAVEHAQQAVITAASYAFRSTGSTIGITIASAVYQNILTKELRAEYGSLPDAEGVIRKIRDNMKFIDHLPDGWHKSVVREMEMDAFRGVFLAGVGLALLTGLMSLFMGEHVLHGKLNRK